MTSYFFMTLKIIGAIGLFIFGMKTMSNGIQRVTAKRLRNVLNTGTSNIFKSTVTGFLTTATLQLSSVTTVMIVSFVNAGFLNLRQSVGLIIGANIGTTLKAWGLAFLGYSFLPEDFALILFVPATIMILMNKPYLKHWGEFYAGLSIMLIGLFLLKEIFPNLTETAHTFTWLKSFTDLGFGSVLIFVFLGILITILVQSSSIAIAIATLVTAQHLIPFDCACGVILGANVGTTITANIAATIANNQAKRAARIHFLFNILGCLWILPLFYPFTHLIESSFANTNNIDSRLPFMLAAFHTGFNLITAAILINFSSFLEKTSAKLISNKHLENSSFEPLGDTILQVPELAILEIEKRISNFAILISKLTGQFQHLLNEQDSKKQQKIITAIQETEEYSDLIKQELDLYLDVLSEAELSKETSKSIRTLMFVSSQLEDISDIFRQMANTYERKRDEQIWFSPEQRLDLKRMLNLIEEAFYILNLNLNKGKSDMDLRAAQSKEKEINAMRDYMRQAHMIEIEQGELSVKNTLVYTELFNFCEKIGDQIYAIAEAQIGESVTSRGFRING